MKKFEQEIDHIRDQINQMGDLAESMVKQAVGAVVSQDLSVIDTVNTEEDQLDQLQLDVDHDIVRLLTVYTPVASSLRYLLTISHVNTALERIGDQAVNLCDDLKMVGEKTEIISLPKIKQMAELVIDMVDDSLKALRRSDADMADATKTRDDLVDSLKDQVVTELLSERVVRAALAESGDISSILGQILIASSLEKIADQACNICNEVVYMVSGQDIRHMHDQGETAALSNEA